jgi:hypothetical protein
MFTFLAMQTFDPFMARLSSISGYHAEMSANDLKTRR